MDTNYSSFENYGTNVTSTSYVMAEVDVASEEDLYDDDINDEVLRYESSDDDEIDPPTYMQPPIAFSADGSGSSDVVINDWQSSHLHMNDVEIAKGMIFDSKNALVDHVRRWHIKNGREFITSKSETKFVVMKCKSALNNCPWRIRGHFESTIQMWVITKCDHDHLCTNEHLRRSNRQLSSSFVASHVFPLVAADNGLKISVIIASVKTTFGYDVSYAKAWHAKQKVLEQLFGTHEAAFPKLPRLLIALQKSNPGTVVHFQHKREEIDEYTFGFVFWAFGAAIEGFKHCRPLISIDATHLYGKYQGKLLVGVTYDANNQLFPLCYALADSESNESWTLFLTCLKHFITSNREEGICLLSDRHKSIIHAVNIVFPEPEGYHRYCSRHLASNFNTRFKNTMIKNQFKTMAACPNKARFDLWYDNFCNLGTDGDYKTWIERISKKKWALAYDGGHRFGIMTTNLVEVFNGVLKGTR